VTIYWKRPIQGRDMVREFKRGPKLRVWNVHVDPWSHNFIFFICDPNQRSFDPKFKFSYATKKQGYEHWFSTELCFFVFHSNLARKSMREYWPAQVSRTSFNVVFRRICISAMAIMVCIGVSLIFLIITRSNRNLNVTNVGRNVGEFSALGENMVQAGPGHAPPRKIFKFWTVEGPSF